MIQNDFRRFVDFDFTRLEFGRDWIATTIGEIALRGSGVLIHKNGEWKITHYVLSLPVPNEKFSEVLELIGG